MASNTMNENIFVSIETESHSANDGYITPNNTPILDDWSGTENRQSNILVPFNDSKVTELINDKYLLIGDSKNTTKKSFYRKSLVACSNMCLPPCVPPVSTPEETQ